MTTAAAPVREWPTSIGEHKEALEKALRMDPEFAMWPEDTKIVTAAQPARIGKAMVEAHHPLLKLRRISYLWVESISGRGGLVLAKAAIASAKIKFFGKSGRSSSSSSSTGPRGNTSLIGSAPRSSTMSSRIARWMSTLRSRC